MEQQELMLKKKATLLEEFLRNGGMEPRAVEDRVEILKARVEALEAELLQKGKLISLASLPSADLGPYGTTLSTPL